MQFSILHGIFEFLIWFFLLLVLVCITECRMSRECDCSWKIICKAINVYKDIAYHKYAAKSQYISQKCAIILPFLFFFFFHFSADHLLKVRSKTVLVETKKKNEWEVVLVNRRLKRNITIHKGLIYRCFRSREIVWVHCRKKNCMCFDIYLSEGIQFIWSVGLVVFGIQWKNNCAERLPVGKSVLCLWFLTVKKTQPWYGCSSSSSSSMLAPLRASSTNEMCDCVKSFLLNARMPGHAGCCFIVYYNRWEIAAE